MPLFSVMLSIYCALDWISYIELPHSNSNNNGNNNIKYFIVIFGVVKSQIYVEFSLRILSEKNCFKRV